MSKLDELIKELCPNGVEYKELGEYLDYIQPTKYIVESTDYKDEYNIPVLTAGQTFILGYTDEIKGIYEAGMENPVIIFDDFTGSMHWINFKFKIKSSAMKIIIPRANVSLNFKYFYYLLRNIKYSSETHTRLWISVFSKFLVPVPPLEVQNEIVKILDDYTKFLEKLKEKLNEELIARKNQYSWYRDYLLKFENKIKTVKLGDISSIVRGASPRPISNYITFEEDGVNWIKIGDVNPESKYVEKTKEKITLEGAKKSRIVKKGDLILSNSMSFGRPYIVNQKGCIHDGWILISDYQTSYSTDFLYYLLTSNKVQKYMRDNVISGTVQNLNTDIVKNIEIPLLSLEVQKRIVEVLDNFEKICNDLNIGLPAEIEARQKQYEFYRNFLLTFKIENCTLPKTRQDKTRQDIIKLFMYIFGYIELELGEILKIKNGSDYKKFNIGNIPVYGSGGIINYIDTYIYDKESVLIPRKGSIRNLFYVDKPFWTVDTIFYTVIDKDVVIPKYLYYYLSKMNLEKLNTAGGVPSLTQTVLNKILIPLPPLEEQQRIVDILDRFDKLCNDISEGLSAEIEAKQKQYEYYREKLLTFKKIIV
ncbi:MULTISPECIES: restriction endonuclease subunit S [Fusobacterium]|uniref:restriction endonuclease subunit S n=1 Tax=Fusobacterium TaxID=848 RepID=UPI000452A5BD|nr:MULTISPECIES: restriction endonuclease subunit S [Fusobacterium]EUB40890.1 type I restriction modification DNA specificity domain protein [Fusobacterium sp. CM1]QYR64520.1 restriction endonuclease subunit S [Fusobacterium animalis]